MTKVNEMTLINDLFYDQQMKRDSNTWSLSIGDFSVTGLIKDDEISFSVANRFANSNITDPINEIVSGVMSSVNSVTPWINTSDKMITSTITQLANSMGSGLVNKVGASILDTASANARKDFDKVMNQFTSKTQKYGLHNTGSRMTTNPMKAMNGKFVSASQLVQVFSGTDIGIDIPTLNTTVFHRSGNNVMSMIKSCIDKSAGDTTSKTGLYGFQEAPNDYEPDLQLINRTSASNSGNLSKIKGTWTLRWGHYKIPNMLLDNFRWVVSKYNAMDLSGASTNDPYYADLTFTVSPATMITKNDLLSILNIKST